MKRFALLTFLGVTLAVPAIAVAAGPADAAHELLKQAQTASSAGNWDDVIELNEEVITQHPEEINAWSSSQMSIAQALAKKGDLAGALQAAHLAIDSAPFPQAFDNAVLFAAQVMSAQDKNVDRANQLITFALQGGKTNPMDAVGYPAQPEREKAFAAMRQQAGDDATASRVRAFTYLLTGKPKDALAQFADEFRRSANPTDEERAAADLVGIGLRDLRGNRVDLDHDFAFVMYGPNGPDGKPGTADDIPDPFAAYLPPAPAVGQGGLSGADPASLALLHQMADSATLYVGDPLLVAEVRRPALSALIRATSALDGWGAPGQVDWYLDFALGRNGLPRSDSGTGGLYLTAAELAARGRDCHFGNIALVWQTVDADSAAKNLPPDKGFERVRTQNTKLMTDLGKMMTLPKITLKPLAAPATF